MSARATLAGLSFGVATAIVLLREPNAPAEATPTPTCDCVRAELHAAWYVDQQGGPEVRAVATRIAERCQ